MGFHFFHVFLIRTEDNVLALLIFHVLLKDSVHAVCLFQGTAKLLQKLLILCNQSLIGQCLNPLFQLLQFLSVGIHGDDILWCRQDFPDDCFS